MPKKQRETGPEAGCAILAGALLLIAAAPPVQYYSGGKGMPFSEAVQVGDMVYLSGQIGAAPGAAGVVPGGIDAEARQALDNVGAILKRRGLTYADVVKCTVMLSDMADWPAFNKIYTGYFASDRLPARSAFGSSGLAYGGKVELECWAHDPRVVP